MKKILIISSIFGITVIVLLGIIAVLMARSSNVSLGSYFSAVKMIDQNGNAKSFELLDGTGGVSGLIHVVAQEYLYSISEGDIAGHSNFTKLGTVTNVVNASQDVWETGGTYVFPTTTQQLKVFSASGNDTSAGTGIQKIKIEYLDNNWDLQTTEVTMNGVTVVNTTPTDIRRVNKVYASQVGTGAVAAGNISVTAQDVSIIYGRISAGYTQSRQLIYTVPNGKTLYITSFTLSSGVGNTTAAAKANYVTFTNRATVDPGTGALSTIFYPFSETGIENGSFVRHLEVPSKIPAQADLKISVIGDTAQAVTCNAAIRGWIE